MILDGLTDDEWNSHVMQGEAFTAEVAVIAVPAMIPLAQIFNPLGSGVRIRLRCMEPMTFLGGGTLNQNIRRHDIALPSLFAPPFGGPENLLGGGAASVAEFRFDNPGAAVGSPFWLILSTGPTRRDYPALQLAWGHDLLPGQGIVNNGSVGGLIILGYQWVEVPL